MRSIRLCLLSFVFSPFAAALPQSIEGTVQTSGCRCFPGDKCWPKSDEWQSFNATINGRLVDTVPIGSVCHGSTFNPGLCETLRSEYNNPDLHINSSSSLMAPFWANRSCDVFGNRDDQCVKGTYIQYAVRVEEVSDVVKTMAFAKSKNIRLVIRNTGHDYLGKSTGAGALGLWMHHLKGFEVSDYKSKQYTGKAVTLGAGMMSQDATAKAHDQGLTIVGGNCPSVGLAGGYTQGGGIGPLTSRYGFGADQVLSWKVVTVDGNILDATPEKNSDLYWALSGGGGGTYGVVVSMTVKAHPEQRTASANLTFGSSGVTEDQFYGAIGDFHEILPKLSSSGGVAIYIIQSTGFSLIPAMLPGATQKELDLFFQPFLKKLQGMNITYTYSSMDVPSYYEAYKSMIAPSETAYFQIGARVLDSKILKKKSGQLGQAIRELTKYGTGVAGLSYQVPKIKNRADNAVSDSMRSGALSLTVGTIWSNTDWNLNVANQNLMTDVLLPVIDKLQPGQTAAYLNEGDYREPKWQSVFYGSSYSRLSKIKKKYDPENFLWARTAVGSEAWVERQDKRLCRNK